MVVIGQILFLLIYISEFPRYLQEGSPTVFAIGAVLVWILSGIIIKKVRVTLGPLR